MEATCSLYEAFCLIQEFCLITTFKSLKVYLDETFYLFLLSCEIQLFLFPLTALIVSGVFNMYAEMCILYTNLFEVTVNQIWWVPKKSFYATT